MTEGEYDACITTLASMGLKAIEGHIDMLSTSTSRPHVFAAVFDVDDTLVTTNNLRDEQFHKKMASGADHPSWLLKSAFARHHRAPLVPLVELYRALQSRGIRMIILTGRSGLTRDVTLDNLRAIGVDGWDHAIFREPYSIDQYAPAQEYKSRQRTRLANAGYTVVANVGDQESDLVGPHSGIAIKLPNPMYLIH